MFHSVTGDYSWPKIVVLIMSTNYLFQQMVRHTYQSKSNNNLVIKEFIATILWAIPYTGAVRFVACVDRIIHKLSYKN